MEKEQIVQLVHGRKAVPVAVIGIACIFPKSPGLKDYWRLIFNAENAIVDVPDSHWSPDEYFDNDPSTPDHTYCKRGGFLPAVNFDPTEFGVPPKALEATDTSQLLSLLTAKSALADAGYGDGREFDRERTSVILGVTGTQELVIPLGARLGFPKWRSALDTAGVAPETAEEVIRHISNSYVSWQEGSFPGLLGNVVAGRISNRLDLRGTNCVVDAACASSLSAVHLALLEITSGRSDMVVTGGVDTLNDIFMHMCFAKTQILSPTGDARPFSIDADGTVLGEGIGMLVLKRLTDAEKDGDRIYAVIRGIGSSSDGKSQSIYSPRAEGQAVALQRAYDQAGIDPKTVDLVETHGTGTKVGDAVEFNALCQVFNNDGANTSKCAIGSVKSMIGHTKAAAGAAGLIKSVLAVHHKVLPPTLKVDKPDPKLGIEKSPFYINPISKPWLTDKTHPRRCGVSAFGFGGSNFHIVLEEHQKEKTEISWDGSVEIFSFSASSKANLVQKIENSQKDVEDGLALSEAAARSRREFNPSDRYRITWVYDHYHSSHLKGRLKGLGFPDVDLQELINNSESPASFHKGVYFGKGSPKGKLAFLFPGQGSQYPGMARDLVCRFPEALKALEAACQLFGAETSLQDAIYPNPASSPDEQRFQIDTLRQTHIAQPAIGAVSLAMFKVLKSFGVAPHATAGHSFGELTALLAAGRISESTYLTLAENRGRLMAAASTGDSVSPSGMLAVKAPIQEIDQLIDSHNLDVVLANRNAPQQGVIAGSIDALNAFESICRRKGFSSVMLPVGAAFHSAHVESAQLPFKKLLDSIKVSPTHVTVFSNTTAEPYPDDPAAAINLLGNHLVQPVDFVREIRNLFQSGIRYFAEVGPRNVLSGLVKNILDGEDFITLSLDASAGRKSGLSDLAHVLCQLSALGFPVTLNQWESPAKNLRKPLMEIPLTGANYRDPSTLSPRPSTKSNKAHKNYKQHNLNNTHGGDGSTHHPLPSNQAKFSDGNPEAMKNTTSSPDVDLIKQALLTVQKSLESMQTLQRQTAEAHQKFLDTQQEAGRTLQHMLEHSHRLTGLTSPIEQTVEVSPNVPDRPSSAGQVSDVSPLTPQASHTAELPIESASYPAKIPSDPVTAGENIPTVPVTMDSLPSNESTLPSLAQPATEPKKTLKPILLSVVSELTGYPVEMIDPDMDIESDLGIDSIKRVEILSTLEERIPGIPTVAPDVIGKLKTLRQVAELLEGSGSERTSLDDNPSPQDLPIPGEASVNLEHSAKDDLRSTLLEVVSELTGYPVEMIGTDMDIEADLGIDSIKRVEILSAVEERMPGLPTVAPDQMGKMKTLQQIVEYMGSETSADATPQPEVASMAESDSVDLQQHQEPGNDPLPVSPLNRQTIKIVDKNPGRRESIVLPAGRKVYITEDGSGVSAALADRLGQLDINTVLISPNILKYKDNLPPAAGLIFVLSPDNPMSMDELKEYFRLTKRLAPDLKASAALGGALFATVSRLDGTFGFKGHGVAHPLQGALAGLVKTAAIEWEDIHCRALDVAPDWQNPNAIAAKLEEELLGCDSSEPIEIGLDVNRRCVLELQNSPLTDLEQDENLFGSDDVVIITGGAKGVTAASAIELASVATPAFVLLGRSPAPFSEPDWLDGLEKESRIKQAILKHEMNGTGSPAQLEAAYKKYMSNREISNNLKAIKDAGASARYFSVDIRDTKEVQRIIEEVVSAQGPVKAIIHGAGVLEDRLIEDKTADQFQKVFDTKVGGLQNVLATIDTNNLRHLVLFSSVSGRMGNQGQADYAMANEAINKMAQQFAAQTPTCRVLAINWGPWDGGMVTARLKREFQRRGVELIPSEIGTRQLINEMRAGGQTPVEIVVGGTKLSIAKDIKEKDPTDDDVIHAGNNLSLTFQRDIDLGTHPFLASHVIGGKPVVPLALMTEWFGHGALHENPGLLLQGLDDIRVLKGIKIEGSKKHVRLLAGRAQKSGEAYEVPVELRDGVHSNVEVVHSKAKAILVDSLQPAPEYRIPDKLIRQSYNRPMAEVYEQILFHGPDLRGIQDITHLSNDGMIARLNLAPAPSEWVKEPLRNKWIADPLALDAAFQMATVWCFEEKGAVSLPSYCAAYRQYRSRFPNDGLTAILELDSAGSHKIRGSIIFLDSGGKVVARISGYEAIMDQTLHRAFKPEAA